jgi:hypothetical protein
LKFQTQIQKQYVRKVKKLLPNFAFAIATAAKLRNDREVLVKMSTIPQEFRAFGLKNRLFSRLWRFKWTGATRQSAAKKIPNSSSLSEIPALHSPKSRKQKLFVGVAL